MNCAPSSGVKIFGPLHPHSVFECVEAAEVSVMCDRRLINRTGGGFPTITYIPMVVGFLYLVAAMDW